MLADVAKAGGAEQCVGNGMKHDVSIAMARKAAVMRHFYAAKDERSFTREGVNVKTRAGPRNEPSGKPSLRTFEICSQGELVELRIAFHASAPHACCPKDCCFVRWRRAGPRLVSGFEGVETEGLRGLHSVE